MLVRLAKIDRKQGEINGEGEKQWRAEERKKRKNMDALADYSSDDDNSDLRDVNAVSSRIQ